MRVSFGFAATAALCRGRRTGMLIDERHQAGFEWVHLQAPDAALIAAQAVLFLLFVFFFFQAEDGIRDVAVTGVQTCALPICRGTARWSARWSRAARCPSATWPPRSA